MQDVKLPNGDGSTAPAQPSVLDAAMPDATLPVANPPALIPQPPPPSGKPAVPSKLRLWLILAGLLVVVGGGAGGGWYWWKHHQAVLPDGIVWGNGRLEADDIDITPKYPGRVAVLLADEGDLVKAGQVVARMDTRDAEATLQKAEAQVQQASACSRKRPPTWCSRRPSRSSPRSSSIARELYLRRAMRPMNCSTSASRRWTAPTPR